ncbi:MAG TPA: hypothetical protein VFW82_01310, partial [Dyella sp.]|nr:hypothetical protein [Dyella sp.]
SASPFAPLLRRSGYFLLATQEKVTRAPKAHETPLPFPSELGSGISVRIDREHPHGNDDQ